MSATEVLRRLLDERGVEWKEHRHMVTGSRVIQCETLWGQPIDDTTGKPIPHVYHSRATEMGDGRLFLEAQLVTPEQVVAATLGPCNDSCNCTNGERTDLAAENAKLREQAARLFDTACKHVADLQGVLTENAALQEQMERLVTLLRNDCDIEASWDGLRRFWSIELTEGGCLMRDRACKAEAENARLRAMRDTWAENDARLRELARDMYEMAYPEFPSAFEAAFADRMAQLGMEVDG